MPFSKRSSKRLAAAAGIFLLARASCWSAVAPAKQDDPQPSENWDATTLEATSVLGEYLYQNNENSSAKRMFDDSLGASTRISAPQGRYVALDLYRSAQLEIRSNEIPQARYHLEILVNRFGDTVWAARGEALLKTLPKPAEIPEGEDALGTLPDAAEPELFLRRLQAALRAGKDDETLDECRRFLMRYPEHSSATEVRLVEGGLLLRNGDAAGATPLLESAMMEAADPGLRSKARYLLGLAYLAQGDHASLRRAVPASTPASDRWGAMALVWRGISEEQDGRWESGESLLKKSLQARYSSPARAYALAGLAAGESHRDGRGSSNSMAEAARQSSKDGLDQLDEYAQLTLGELLAGQRRYAEAAKAYEAFESAFPSSADAPEAAYQGAISWKKAKQGQKAADAFARLAQRYPDSAKAQDAYLQMGQIYADQGAVRKAVGAYQQMAKAGGGSDKDAMLLIAKVHYNRKEYDQAIPIYEQFLRDAPNDARAYEVQDLLLSSYWIGKRDDPGLLRAIDAYPDHPVVAHIRWALGAKAYKAKDCASAEPQFRKLVSDFPKSTYVPGSLFYDAECLASQKDYAGAAEAYRKLAAYPKSPYAKEAPFRLGLALMETGDYEGAAAAYQRYKPGPKSTLAADAAFNRALALDKAGNKVAAMSAFEALLAKYPKYPRASWVWLQIATARQAQGSYGPAAQAYAHVAGEDRAQALYNRGWCLEKLKQRKPALIAYEQLRLAKPAADPFRLKGVLRLALLYELASDKRAAGLYREVLTLSSDPALTNVARKRLGLPVEAEMASAQPAGAEPVPRAQAVNEARSQNPSASGDLDQAPMTLNASSQRSATSSSDDSDPTALANQVGSPRRTAAPSPAPAAPAKPAQPPPPAKSSGDSVTFLQ